MWAHCDAAGRILEIELLGDDKPCQVERAPQDKAAAQPPLSFDWFRTCE
jgi:hypothetical protein